jgi:hypothetical protein
MKFQDEGTKSPVGMYTSPPVGCWKRRVPGWYGEYILEFVLTYATIRQEIFPMASSARIKSH